FIVDQTPMIRVGLSKFATDSSLRDDWVMTHEMVHLAFPSVPDEHHWIEEGIATYVEPIARAQVSDLSPEKVWRDLVGDVPKGLPAPGDRGLDNTHTILRCHKQCEIGRTGADFDGLGPNRKRRKTRWRSKVDLNSQPSFSSARR